MLKKVANKFTRSARNRNRNARKEDAEEQARRAAEEAEEQAAEEERLQRQAPVSYQRRKKRQVVGSSSGEPSRASVSVDPRRSTSLDPRRSTSVDPRRSTFVYETCGSSSQQLLLEYYPHQQFGGGNDEYQQHQPDCSGFSQNPRDIAMDDPEGYQHQQQQSGFATWSQNPQGHEERQDQNLPQWRGTRPWHQEEEEEEEEERSSSSRPSTSRTAPLIDPWVKDPCPGGAEFPELLRSFCDHVASDIYKGMERKSLTFQFRHTAVRSWNPGPESPSAIAAISVGLDHIPSIIYDFVDQHLISAFIERWQPETNSFHLPFGEMTITLHDVYLLMGINISGRSMGIPLEQRIRGKIAPLAKKVSAAKRYFQVECDRASVSHSLLRARCESGVLGHTKSASGYLLHLLGSSLFPDKSQDKISLSNIDYVCELEKVGEWAWGAGLLASVYHDLGESTRADCKQISTCYTLILSWIYTYFSTFRPERSVTWDGGIPLVNQWAPSTETARGRNYRVELDAMAEDQVDWRPYGYLDFTTPKLAPSLFHGVLAFAHEVTEPYMPDRVARQFGRVQMKPGNVIEPYKARRYRSAKRYNVEYTNSDWVWDMMNFHSIDLDELGPVAGIGHEVSSDYMEWYLPRTHPRIIPPSADDYRSCFNRVRGYLMPYYNPGEYEMKDVLDAVRYSIEDMRPFE